MKPAVQKVRAAIAEHGLDREVIELEVHARTSQQAADALGVTVGQIVKSLVFTVDGRPLLVVASGVNRVDERRLGYELVYAAAGLPECVFPLAPDELVRATGGQVVDIKAGGDAKGAQP